MERAVRLAGDILQGKGSGGEIALAINELLGNEAIPKGTKAAGGKQLAASFIVFVVGYLFLPLQYLLLSDLIALLLFFWAAEMYTVRRFDFRPKNGRSATPAGRCSFVKTVCTVLADDLKAGTEMVFSCNLFSVGQAENRKTFAGSFNKNYVLAYGLNWLNMQMQLSDGTKVKIGCKVSLKAKIKFKKSIQRERIRCKRIVRLRLIIDRHKYIGYDFQGLLHHRIDGLTIEKIKEEGTTIDLELMEADGTFIKAADLLTTLSLLYSRLIPRDKNGKEEKC
mgnify:FL=1